jgi:hypothetical protein
MLLEIAGAILWGMSSTGHEKQQLTFGSERRRSSQTIDRKAYLRRGLAQIASDHREKLSARSARKRFYSAPGK